MKTTLPIAADALAVALAIGCGWTDDTKPGLAPITTECMLNAYQNYNSTNNDYRRTFALAKCMQNTDVRSAKHEPYTTTTRNAWQ